MTCLPLGIVHQDALFPASAADHMDEGYRSVQ